MSVLNSRTDEVPVAIIDFETTGLSPKTGARIVEVAAVRINPGEQPRVLLDTLVNPQGPVHCTEIHGITDDDVVGAPRFADIADELTEALSGAVVAAYNAAFDMSFLNYELSRAGAAPLSIPFICLMYLRPLLSIGPRCDLASACEQLGMIAGDHRAADDAVAESCLWGAYRDAAKERGIATFADLATLKPYKFTKSFEFGPLTTPLPPNDGIAPKPRTTAVALQIPEPWPPKLVLDNAPAVPASEKRNGEQQESAQGASSSEITKQSARRIYWHALVNAIEDLEASPEEVSQLASLRARYPLDLEDLYALHARLFAERVLEMARDDRYTAEEVDRTQRLALALQRLGWCPGPAPVPQYPRPSALAVTR